MKDEPRNMDLKASLAESEVREASSRREAFEASAWLAAIVDNSDDAILSKTLDGVIMSWNAGAEKLFGFPAIEAVGRPITIIIPEERRHEEETIIRKLRAGERIDHFETVRRRKDGSLVDIALTVSPVKDASGRILGASKIARDITPAKRAAERQALLLREMNHRVKNLFALTSALVSLSAREAKDVEALQEDLTARIGALARAHALTLPDVSGETIDQETSLAALLRAILAAHDGQGTARFTIAGDDALIGANALPTIALVLHELATNATKYGGLAGPDGRLSISMAANETMMVMDWLETGAPRHIGQTLSEGFGSRLEKASLASLNATINRTWLDRGLDIRLTVPLEKLAR